MTPTDKSGESRNSLQGRTPWEPWWSSKDTTREIWWVWELFAKGSGSHRKTRVPPTGQVITHLKNSLTTAPAQSPPEYQGYCMVTFLRWSLEE
jgi:hypothetical protein